jgi:hypothetical protein
MRNTAVAELPRTAGGKTGLRSVGLDDVGLLRGGLRDAGLVCEWPRLLGSLDSSPNDTGLGPLDSPADTVPVVVARSFSTPTSGQPVWWLNASMLALGVLAVAAAVVSYEAQYRMVFAAKGVAPVAALEAGIPDVAALVFATLGIALALNGRRAIRARVLNVSAVATSVTMNVLAAGTGWKDLTIWAMPPIAYALASDTAIGVVRAWTIARHRAMNAALADDEATPLTIIGGTLLWLLRLALAPVSTLAGFRDWVLDECPVAPGRRDLARLNGDPRGRAGRRPASGTKTAQFLALVIDRYGPLSDFPIGIVSRVCSELAPEVDLDPGSARTALRRHVLAAQRQETRS